MSVRLRVAPSPTGDPHVGTAYMTLFNLAYARQQGGQFILRIEDTDRARFDARSEAAIFSALLWLGFEWDEGPDIGGPYGPYRQSERVPIYREHAEELVAVGGAYPCFCSPERLEQVRREQQERKAPPHYDRHCRGLSPAEAATRRGRREPYVIRLAMPDQGETVFHDLIRGKVSFENRLIDDQVLMKSDGYPTYHLAAVVDDHLMSISHIVRAEEWISSVPKHLQIFRAFGWEPPLMAHMPLLRNADRSKISKRKNPVSLEYYRDEGYLPEAVVNFLGLLGWSMPAPEGQEPPEIFTFEDVVRNLSWDRIVTSGPVFDLNKLTWLNGHYIRALSPGELQRRLKPWMPSGADPVMLARVVPLAQERLKRLGEFPELTDYFFGPVPEYDPALLMPKRRSAEETAAALCEAHRRLEACPQWKDAALEQAMRVLVEERGWKAGELFMALRVAVTGKMATPPLFATIAVLGRERSLGRIREAAAKLTPR